MRLELHSEAFVFLSDKETHIPVILYSEEVM